MKLAVLLMVMAILPLGAWAQNVTSANLRGTVKDTNGTPVAGATITVSESGRDFSRTVQSAADGSYFFALLPPADYSLKAEAAGYSSASMTGVILTVGQEAVLPIVLSSSEEIVQVVVERDSKARLETERSTTTDTITQERINSLPINGRNYVQFALTDAQVKPDGAPVIPYAPTSGLNFSGARARSNLVNVDGADAEDSIINGIRSTVSQEAVQEFQILTNSFAPEYGRSSGGVINIVTRGGSNDFHGNVFTYFRNRSLQAVNPFSNVANPAYTRVQPGVTLGGPIRKDRTFFFFSYEMTRREETGFSTIGAANFGLVSIDASPFLGPGATILGTPDQKAFLENPATPVNGNTVTYAALVGQGSATALQGIPGTSTFATSGEPLPASFVPLQSLIGNYPITEKTGVWGMRVDHKLSDMQQLFLRVNVSPSLVTGLQSQGAGQNPGLNAFTRTDQQQYHDITIAASHLMLFGGSKFNEVRFQFSRRGLGFDVANTPGSLGVGVDIPGFAFFGRDPNTYLHRIEKRWEVADNFTWNFGHHSVKFGGDTNYIPLSVSAATNFGGDFQFSDVSLFLGLPSFSPVQAYGLGLPQSFTQGLGVPNTTLSDKTLGAFLQDSWKLRSNLTLNYGLRYDFEFTPTFPASTAMAAAAQQALGVTEGIPQDKKAIAPRLGLAWDPWKDGKTVVRASAGIFYDHPALGIAYQSVVEDGSKTPTVEFFGGAPCTTTDVLAFDPTRVNAANIFQGSVQNANCLSDNVTGYLANQQRFDPANTQIIERLSNQGYLQPSYFFPLISQPFGLATAKNFAFAYAKEADLQIEKQLGHGYTFMLAYDYSGGRHLPYQRDFNPENQTALVSNWEKAVAAGAVTPDTLPIAVDACGSGPAGAYFPAALLSFFRTSGVNPSLAPVFPGACVAAATAAYPGLPVPVPFAAVTTEVSDGTSSYHAFTANLKKSFGKHVEFQASYTWSHVIDIASDIYGGPQNPFSPAADRGSSALDQRHRFVLSGVYNVGRHSGSTAMRHLLSDWTIAPLITFASGRPFNIVTGSTALRPNVASAGQTDLCGDTAVASRYSPSGYLIPVCTNDGVYDGIVNVPLYGTLGRNTGITPMTVFTDLRVGREFGLNERFRLTGYLDMFNVINKFNVQAVNTLYTQAGTPTAAFDPRQLQLGLKVSW
jgi:carboxypeptidase family protein/TonB-dependent receptor-like protein